MSKKLKYSPEQIQSFLDYAKENKIGILNTLKHFNVNRRTFYITCHRFGMSTDSGRKNGWRTVAGHSQGHVRAMSKEQVEQILQTAQAKRISHKKACAEFGFSYNTYRGAIVRLGIKAERFSSTYSKEDIEKTFEYAKANHISLAKACKHFNYKYHLLNPSAKRYNLKFKREITILPEAKALSDKEAIGLYLAKGYVANEIFAAMKKMGRQISRGMCYYHVQSQSNERIQTKIDKLKERLESLKSSQAVKV